MYTKCPLPKAAALRAGGRGSVGVGVLTSGDSDAEGDGGAIGRLAGDLLGELLEELNGCRPLVVGEADVLRAIGDEPREVEAELAGDDGGGSVELDRDVLHELRSMERMAINIGTVDREIRLDVLFPRDAEEVSAHDPRSHVHTLRNARVFLGGLNACSLFQLRSERTLSIDTVMVQ